MQSVQWHRPFCAVDMRVDHLHLAGRSARERLTVTALEGRDGSLDGGVQPYAAVGQGAEEEKQLWRNH